MDTTELSSEEKLDPEVEDLIDDIRLTASEGVITIMTALDFPNLCRVIFTGCALIDSVGQEPGDAANYWALAKDIEERCALRDNRAVDPDYPQPRKPDGMLDRLLLACEAAVDSQ
jgi:hypothetical protein